MTSSSTGTAGEPRSLTFSNADEAFRFALERHAAGAAGEAADVYGQLLKHSPQRAELLRLYGLALTQCGEPERGLPYLQKAVGLAPRHALAHLHQGLALLALERLEDAAKVFRRAARLDHQDPAPRLNLANVLLQLGKPAEALTVAQKAVGMAPGMPEAWHNQGLALLALDRHAEARDSFLRAVALREDFPDAWVSLGKTEKALGNFDEAEAALRNALVQDGSNVAAAVNLANWARERGNTEQAEGLYRQVLAVRPDLGEANLGLAGMLMDLERFEEAMNLLESMQVPPRLHGQWLQQRAAALLGLEREEEGRAALAEAQARYADDLGVLVLRLQLALRDQDRTARSLVQRIETRLDSPQGLLFRDRVTAYFLLGDYWHRQEDRARAFQQWRRGHALLAQAEPFSQREYRRFVAALKEHFGTQRFKQDACADNRDELPVFIVGMPRSGTTLVEQILDSHARIHGGGERPDIPRRFLEWGGSATGADAAKRVAALGADVLSRAADEYLQSLRALAPDGARFVIDKMPHNFHYLGLIALLFPKARVIYCRRDPRDTALSIYRLRFLGRHEYAHRLEDLALAFREHESLMNHWQTVLPLSIHTVDYEALVRHFEAEVGRLLDFLELDFDEACLRFHENPRPVSTASRGQVRRPITQSAIGQWRDYEPWLRPLCKALEEPE